MIETQYEDDYFLAYEHHNMYERAHAFSRPEWCEVCTQIVEYEQSQKALKVAGLFITSGVLFFAILFIGLLINGFTAYIYDIFMAWFYGGKR